MKKTLCLIVSLIILGISGCDVFLGPDVPVGMGTLSISFGEDGGNRSAFDVSEDTQKTLRYDLVLTGPDRQKITTSFAVGQTFNGQVALGEWLIEAKAFAPGDILFGAGSTTITVRAGANQVRVPMTKVLADTPVSALDLTALVTAPVRDAAPVTVAIDEAQYTGTIAWQNPDNTNVTGNFAPSTIYQAVVSLTATTGYTFDGVDEDSFIYAYTGATTTNAAGSGTTITVTIVFPATAAPGATTVNALDLTALVAAPERDATPNTAAINEPQYTGTIAWQNADGTSLSGNFAPSTAYTAVISLAVKTGYTFAGVGAGSFSHDGALSITNSAGSGAAITVTISFPATAAMQHTITFDSHEGSAVTPITENTGTPVDRPTDPTRTGYSFQGWFDAESGGVLYPWPHTLTANVTMHAQWQNSSQPPPTQYTITFDSHSGSAVPSITANVNTAVNKPANPTWTGYSFQGWFNAATGGTEYAWPHTLAGNIIMHAKWTANTYTVEYNANGGTGTTASSAHTYDQAKNLTANTFTWNGYTFSGWNTQPNGSGTNHTNSESVINLSAANGATVTLYAQWTVNAFDLTTLGITPVKDMAPDITAIDTIPYTGNKSWQKWDGTNFTNFNGNFAPSTIYQAVINLTVKIGFTFTGVNADSFTYTGATATNLAGSGTALTVTITFPATAADVVNALDLTALVIAPEKGATPGTAAINEPQYTGTITWNPADSPFAPSTIYQAVINLTATAGYTFAGVGADSFIYAYTGATATNPAGSGTTLTVTIGFPATADPHTIILNPDAGDEAFSQASFAISGTATQTVAVVAGLGYTNPRWFVDGDLKGTTGTITIDAADYSDSPGVHNLTLFITKSGVFWSKEITFIVN